MIIHELTAQITNFVYRRRCPMFALSHPAVNVNCPCPTKEDEVQRAVQRIGIFIGCFKICCSLYSSLPLESLKKQKPLLICCQLVTLARPSVSSSLEITNRSFTYASPHLWNQLPSTFRQPHSVHCPPGSHNPARITSSQSPPSISPSITVTPLAFHSRLKTHLFHKSFASVFLIPSALPSRILNLYWTKWAMAFVCFSFFLLYIFLFLADRTNGRAYATELRLSSVT